MMASNNSLPSLDGTLMRTAPLRTAIIWSPGDPIEKMPSPASNVRMRARAEIAARSLSLRPSNRTHLPRSRRASTSASFLEAPSICALQSKHCDQCCLPNVRANPRSDPHLRDAVLLHLYRRLGPLPKGGPAHLEPRRSVLVPHDGEEAPATKGTRRHGRRV